MRPDSVPVGTGLRHVGRLLIGGFRRPGKPGVHLRPARVDGAIRTIRSACNPEKPGHVGPVPDIALLPEK
ncbi:hypothetical protein OG871_32905 [Kitasatospora sp. NBC_00374]|uniref:hypothetical protein n=1 Tax=Kitasatospora sp. NBC_00374 TaxID=2975964 RepID=UPI0030E4F5A9